MFAYICLILSVAVASIVSHGHGGHHVTCKGEPMTHNNEEVILTMMNDCFDQVVPSTSTTTSATTSSEEKFHQIHNNTCFDVCLWKKQKLLKDDGTYNSDGTNIMVKGMFPAIVQADIKKAYDDCALANSKSFSMDNKCEGYKKFKECKHVKFFEICDIKMNTKH